MPGRLRGQVVVEDGDEDGFGLKGEGIDVVAGGGVEGGGDDGDFTGRAVDLTAIEAEVAVVVGRAGLEAAGPGAGEADFLSGGFGGGMGEGFWNGG